VSGQNAVEMKREHELGLVAEMEEELMALDRPKVSRFAHSEFLRVGLPILSGMLDDTFSPLRWEEFVGNQYVGVEIFDDTTYDILYTLPPLMRQAPTAINDNPNAETLTSESQHLFSIRDFNPNEASAQILNVAEETMVRQNGSLEYGTLEEARETMNVLNAIFRDNNLGELPMPEYLKEVKVEISKVETQGNKPKVETSYDFDEGEEL
tara:strand:+ start:109 stop:735 length:627 start_codon:yes stop_codon:yes gene_type:complete